MLDRCRNPNAPLYRHYGHRGISVCSEWYAFEEFREWANNNGYRDSLTIERVDNDRGYEPANCKWATRQAQARNRRSSRLINWQGRERTLAELAEISGISHNTLWKRLALGWSVERAMKSPLRRTTKGTP